MTATDTATLLGGNAVLGRSIDSDLDLVEAVEEGLPTGVVENLLRHIDLTASDIHAILPERTRHHTRNRERLTPELSDRIARFARLYQMASETLGGSDKAARWLKEPNRALGGRRPLDFARSSSGALLVEDVLTRIAYGVYS